MSHAFAIGQTVQYFPGPGEIAAERGTYTVVRQLPKDGRDYQYHIKHAASGELRLVREPQLS